MSADRFLGLFLIGLVLCASGACLVAADIRSLEFIGWRLMWVGAGLMLLLFLGLGVALAVT